LLVNDTNRTIEDTEEEDIELSMSKRYNRLDIKLDSFTAAACSFINHYKEKHSFGAK